MGSSGIGQNTIFRRNAIVGVKDAHSGVLRRVLTVPQYSSKKNTASFIRLKTCNGYNIIGFAIYPQILDHPRW